MDIAQYHEKLLHQLKKQGVFSERLEKKFKLINTKERLDKEFAIIKRKISILIKVKENAENWDLPLGFDFSQLLANIDNINVKAHRNRINEKIAFIELRNKCLKAFKKDYHKKEIIEKVIASTSMKHLKKILEDVPYSVLLSNNIIETKEQDKWQTKNSVRVIYTNMKNQ
jgi:hypothetical protein